MIWSHRSKIMRSLLTIDFICFVSFHNNSKRIQHFWPVSTINIYCNKTILSTWTRWIHQMAIVQQTKRVMATRMPLVKQLIHRWKIIWCFKSMRTNNHRHHPRQTMKFFSSSITIVKWVVSWSNKIGHTSVIVHRKANSFKSNPESGRARHRKLKSSQIVITWTLIYLVT